MDYAKWASDILSFALMPQVSSAYAFILLYLCTNPDLAVLVFALVFASGVQLASLVYYVHGARNDPNVADMGKRFWMFSLAFVSYVVGFILLEAIAAPFIFKVLMLAYVFNTIAALLVTKYYTKASIHVWGIAGPSVVMYYCFGTYAMAVTLAAAAIVGMARIKLKQHTLWQVILPFFLSIPLTYIVYQAMLLIP